MQRAAETHVWVSLTNSLTNSALVREEIPAFNIVNTRIQRPVGPVRLVVSQDGSHSWQN